MMTGLDTYVTPSFKWAWLFICLINPLKNKSHCTCPVAQHDKKQSSQFWFTIYLTVKYQVFYSFHGRPSKWCVVSALELQIVNINCLNLLLYDNACCLNLLCIIQKWKVTSYYSFMNAGTVTAYFTREEQYLSICHMM